jgi:hypothetical protein
MFFLIFLRTLVDVLAIFGAFPYATRLLLTSDRGLARTLTGTSIGTRALTAAGQTLAMAETTIATKVHEALDIHGDFTAEVTFYGELRYFVTQTLHVSIRQIFDLDRTRNTGSVTDFLCTCTTDAKNGSQCDFGMLMVGNIYPSNTSH